MSRRRAPGLPAYEFSGKSAGTVGFCRRSAKNKQKYACSLRSLLRRFRCAQATSHASASRSGLPLQFPAFIPRKPWRVPPDERSERRNQASFCLGYAEQGGGSRTSLCSATKSLPLNGAGPPRIGVRSGPSRILAHFGCRLFHRIPACGYRRLSVMSSGKSRHLKQNGRDRRGTPRGCPNKTNAYFQPLIRISNRKRNTRIEKAGLDESGLPVR